MINTHEKLMEYLLSKHVREYDLHYSFKRAGFKGEQKDLIRCLLSGFVETGTFLLNSEILRDPKQHIDEDGYFEIVAALMNKFI